MYMYVEQDDSCQSKFRIPGEVLDLRFCCVTLLFLSVFGSIFWSYRICASLRFARRKKNIKKKNRISHALAKRDLYTFVIYYIKRVRRSVRLWIKRIPFRL